MPAVGGGGVDIRALLGTILNVFKTRANQICAATCDGLVLRMHYRWTFFLLLGNFLTVWYSWYHREVITCVVHFDADKQVRLDYVNICLSYPFIEDPKTKERRYIMFYRWISWSLLVLAGLYYIPRKVSKNFDNSKCKKLIEDLAANSFRYDHSERDLVERAFRYLMFNLRTHNGLYWKYLTVNIVALAVDIFTFLFLNFILQGRFIQYGFNAYPFERDPQKFTDYMSETFPPFVSCHLSRSNQLTSQREETLGCHLTVMELYEKVFLGLWLWLILLTFITCCYIVFLLTMWLPWVKAYLLRTAKPAHANDKVGQIITKVSQNCKIGDIYLLYRLKGHLSHVRFYELLVRLSDPNLVYKPTKQPDVEMTISVEGQLPLSKQEDTLKQRLPNMPQNPHTNPRYLQQLLGNPEILNTHIQDPKKNYASPKDNTSIYM